jgi:8-amino-7-oxononanoate synthase
MPAVMNAFDSDLAMRLTALRQHGLERRLRRIDSPQGREITNDGRVFINFSSNDYLGLANHPALMEAAIEAAGRYGAGAGASRLISGNLAVFQDLDEKLAGFKGTQAALSFATGYSAALGTIGALMGPSDIIIIDKLVHASIVDASRLAGARLRVFRHNDLNHLERLLKWADAQPNRAATGPEEKVRVLVVTESIFSMDGDHAPLREIVELKNRHGAWLMVDEAHATGLYGTNRRGLSEQLGIADQIEVQMGTLGKAVGAAGGYICGSRHLIDFLVNRARSFIFSTAPVPAAAAAATAGLKLISSSHGKERQQRLWQLVSDLARSITTHSSGQSAIIPIQIGKEEKAVAAAENLRQRGIFVPAIRYPTVARGRARLRVTVTAAHQAKDIAELKVALNELNAIAA